MKKRLSKTHGVAKNFLSLIGTRAKPFDKASHTKSNLRFLLVFSGLILSSFLAVAQPTNQVTNVIVKPVSGSSDIRFDWTNGNGNKRLVIIKDATGVFSPTNGSTYAANPDFTAGTNIQTGGGVVKSVFDGTGTTVTVSNLTPGNVYRVEVYEYNTAGNLYQKNVATRNPLWFRTFTTTGDNNWVVPTGINFATVQAWGSGGGGGGGDTSGGTANGGSGGGGGAYAASNGVSVTQGATFHAVVAAGGAGGSANGAGPVTPPGAGGFSFFGPTAVIGASLVKAEGGSAGTSNSTANGGNGGQAANSTGTLTTNNGGRGGKGADQAGGAGGSSGAPDVDGNGINGQNGNDGATTNGGTAPGPRVGGGNGSDGQDDGVNTAMAAAPTPGGGGGGTQDSNTSTGSPGGNGLVLVSFTQPINQDQVFAASISKAGGAAVTVVSSGPASNAIWFAPAGTTTFAASGTMTTAAGNATSINAPATAGNYQLFVVDAAGNASLASTATLTVDNTPPTISGTSPTTGAFVTNSNVSYTLSEPIVAAAGSKIRWARTSGNPDAGSPHDYLLTGGELTATTHTNIPLASVTLVNGTVYTVTFDAVDAAGNPATQIVANNVTMDTSPPTVSAHSITNIVPGGFDYNITSSEVGIAYYEVTTSSTPPTPAEIKAGTGTGHVSSGSFAIPVAAANTTKNITGLNPVTLYYVYAVTEDQALNQSTPVVSDNATTSCAPPTIQATTAGTPFTAINAGTMTYNWTRGNGTGGVLVVARAGAAVTFVPTSGQTYAGQINSNYTSATAQPTGDKIVYRGSAASVALSGLLPGITYNFAVFEYNTTNDCYLLTTPLVQSQATNAASNEATLNNASGVGSISSLVVTAGAEIGVFTFDVTDAGADDLNTLISQMVINPGTGNAFGTLTQLIQGADLFDNLGNSKAATVNAGNITISAIPNGAGQLGEVVDGATKTYTLKIYLNNPLNAAIRATADQQTLALSLTNTDVTASATGSGLAAATVDSGSGNGTIDVVATKLLYIQQPSNVLLLNSMSPSVTVEATDAFGARDKNFTSTVGLVSTGTLQTSPTNATYVQGLGTYPNIIHSATGAARTLNTNSGSVTNTGASSTFNITASNASNIIVNAGFSTPQNIGYDNFQENFDITNSSTSIIVAKFDVQDGGGASDTDSAPTVLNSVQLDLGANFGFIKRLALYDAAGTTELVETAVSSQLVNLSGFTVSAPDNSNASFTVRVSFNQIVVDNTQFSVKINNTTTVTNQSSTFAVANAGGATTSTSGDDNRIEVTASRILFVQQPISGTIVNAIMTPNPSVEAVDVFANRDLDYNAAVAMQSTGTLSSFPLPQNSTFASGLASFNNIVHTFAGSGLQLQATSGVLAAGNSNPFQIVAASSDIIANAAFIYPSSIPYASFQENVDITSSVTSVIVAKFDVRDGPPLGDADNVNTVMTGLTLDLGANYTAIRRIALYNAAGTVEIPGTEVAVSSQTVIFSGMTFIAPDNGSNTFSVRVSFKAPIVDKTQFRFTVTGATALLGGSQFALPNAGGALTSIAGNNNRLEVIADHLRYIQQPSNVLVLVDMAPNITVEAVDPLLSRDVDISTSINVDTPPIYNVNSYNSPGMVSGFATVSNLQFYFASSGVTLQTSNGAGLVDAVSNPFNVTLSTGSDIVVNSGFAYPQNINYLPLQATNITNSNATAITVAKFDIRDGGSTFTDADGAPTYVNAITFDLGPNWAALRRIALYTANELSEYQEQPVTGQFVSFSGMAIQAPDNTFGTFAIRVSFNTAVPDNQQLSFTITSVTPYPQYSSFFVAPDGGAATTSLASNNNRIEVTADRLLYSPQNFTSPLLAAKNIGLQQAQPVIKAFDVNLNVDLDFATTLSLSNAGGIPMSQTTLASDGAAPNAGVYTFPAGFQFLGTGNGTLTATGGFSVVTPAISIIAGTGTTISAGAAAPATISSLVNTALGQVAVFNFDVTDDKTPILATNDDGLPTLISALAVTSNPTFNNIADWTQVIAGAELSDGHGNTRVADFYGLNFITFNPIPTAIGALGYVPDDGVQNYTLKIYLKSTLTPAIQQTIDGLQFQFEWQQINTLYAPNSSFIIGGQNANSGNANVVSVTATQLRFLPGTINPSASLNAPYPGPSFGNQVKVEAVDVNGNRDLGFTGATGTVRLLTNNPPVPPNTAQAMANLPPATFTSGLLAFPTNFMFTSGTNGDIVTLYMAAGANTTCGTDYTTGAICGTSSVITLLSSFESVIKLDPAYTYQPTIPYAKFQATNIQPSDIGANSGSYEIARLILSDGDADGVPGDLDGASTRLTDIKIKLADGSGTSMLPAIRRIALYDGGVPLSNELADKAPSGTDLTNGYVTFSGLNIIAPDDNSPNPAVISVRVSFDNTAANIIDKKLVRLSVVGATLATGSAFRNNVGDIAGFPGGYTAPAAANLIDVIASKLDFTTQPSVAPPAYAGINEPVPFTAIVKARDQFDLVDTDFNGPASLSASAAPTGTFSFSSGILTLGGLRYTNTGSGKLTVTANGLNSNINNFIGPDPNVAVQCSAVNVIHVVSTLALGGVTTSTNLIGGTSGAVIFGVTFTAQGVVGGEPKLNKFVISFSNPISGVLNNPRIFESASANYTVGLPNVTSFGATVTPGANSILVDFTTGTVRDLSGGAKSYFLVVDVDPNANGSTPTVQPSVTDNGFPSPTNTNITVTPVGATAVSNSSTGLQFTFASIFPPTIVSSNPARGQLNVAPNQATLAINFSVPVWTLDGKVLLYDQTAGTGPVTLNALDGAYAGGTIANLASPIHFGLPGGLIADHVYYVTIAPGVRDLNPALSTGIMDQNGNLFQGINSPGALYFKIASTLPPNLLGVVPIGSPPKSAAANPQVVPTSISTTGAVINASFDQAGTAYYLILAAGSQAPATDAEIKGTYLGSAANVFAKGSFPITQIYPSPQPQFGIVSPITPFIPGDSYDVWISADNDAPAGFTASTGFAYGGSTSNFAINGAGPTLSFSVSTDPTNITINTPDIIVCNNSLQVMDAPIIISEGLPGQFQTAGSQSFNLVLPAGFQFDVSTTGSVPNYGNLNLVGSDFAGPGALSFIGNSILTVTFDNNNNASLDKIIITGLRVIANSPHNGPFLRLGGQALSSIADQTSFATITSYDAAAVGFTNSYSTSLATTPLSIVTSIPDNANPSLITLTPQTLPTVAQPLGAPLFGTGTLNDYGPSSFSGPGVSVNQLSLAGVTLDVPFNITITHTDNNGCISNNAIQYTVYNHNNALNITDNVLPAGVTVNNIAPINSFCATNTNFKVNQINSPTYNTAGHVRFLDYSALAAFYMYNAKAEIPSGVPSQIISGPAWKTIIETQLIKQVTATLPPGIPPGHGSHTVGPDVFHDFYFDDAVITDANALSGGVINDPYENFRSTVTSNATGATLTFYTGGSLGFVDITGEFQSRTNSAVKVPRVQRVNFFLPAVPIVDASLPSFIDTTDPANAPNPVTQNPGTLVYCEFGGTINITARPAAIPGRSTGVFTLFEADGVTPVNTTGFLANTNGTASIDPSVLKNGYRDIKIVYTYQDLNSPCSSSAYQFIRVTPNPVANFTSTSVTGPNILNSSFFCVGNQVNFDAAAGTPAPSSISAAPSTVPATPANTITTYAWDFGDLFAPGSQQTSALIAPNHTFNQAQPFVVSLNLVSNWGCASVPIGTTVVGKKTRTLTVGGIPVVKAKFDGVSTDDTFNFSNNGSSVALGTITDYDWDFDRPSAGAFNIDASGPAVTKTFSTPGVVSYDLRLTTDLGCINSLYLTNKALAYSDADNDRLRAVVILPREIAATGTLGYSEDFDASSGNWQVWYASNATRPLNFTNTIPTTSPLTPVPSWTYGAPDGNNIKALVGVSGPTNYWKTYDATTRRYRGNERSALYSPSLDLTNLATPMISFNSFTNLESSDGVVLEYSQDDLNVADPNKVWISLGKVGDGVGWFTDKGVAAKPGNQNGNDFGWSGFANNTWLESKHTLDTIASTGTGSITKRLGKVVFRFALASTKPDVDIAVDQLEGFAIDNVRIGERTRTILLESFANTSNVGASPSEKVIADSLSYFPAKSLGQPVVGTQVIKINYHLNFPANDPFNLDNPADPSSRALFYNIISTPKSILDGSKDAADRPFTAWSRKSYGTRSLQLAQAILTTTVNPPANGAINISVKVEAVFDLPANTILHVAVLETGVPLGSLSTAQKALVLTGESQFNNVLKRMIPSASGTAFGTPLPKKGIRTFSNIQWTPDLGKLYAPSNDLAIVVFLQNESTKEIYQVSYNPNISDPGVVTGVEPVLAEDVQIYPIPANHEMHVVMPGALLNTAPLLMIDQTGRTALQSAIPAGQSSKTLNVSDLAPGVYILQINVGNGNFTRKKVMVVHEGN